MIFLYIPLNDPAIITNRTIAIFDTVKMLLMIVDFFNPNAKATKKILLIKH